LRQSGLPANRLELELIEDATGSDRGVLRTTLQSLRELGVSVSIGQFGRGHSPLAALKELPVTGLRVDRSIVVGVAHDTVDRTIATAVVTMARSLGLQVVAEGVETAEQRDFLLEVGCTQMLGDLFGKPLDEAALRQALASSDAPWDEALAHSR
jgi:EAL domain-containing protein (putative c-di-GMP-specific phosphodiesterase class I)